MEAGGEADASLRIRNTSDIVEEYHIDVVGDPALWCTAEPATLRLYPGTTGTVRLTFAPPRGPDPAAGPHPYGVRVRPVEAPDAVTVPEGNVSVVPFTDVRAELLPVMVRGWRRARPKLVVDNYGNTPVTASVQAAVQDNSVDFDTRMPSFQVAPGRAHFGLLTGRPHRLLWFGQKVRHPFTATVTPSGSPTASVSGTYIQTALLPSWLARVLTALLALAIVFAGLWFMAKPSIASKATALASAAPAPGSQQVQSNSSSQPTPARQPSHPAQPASAPASGKQGGGGAPPSGNKPSVNAKLPQPLGYWKLMDGANVPAPAAADSSPGNHPLTGQNVMWCQDGGCAWFDGSNAAFKTSGTILDTGPGHSFTVSAFVDLASYPPNGEFATAVSQGEGSNMSSAFFLQYDSQGQCWAFARESGRATGDCGGQLTGKWTHLTGVFNGSNNEMRLYVNGKLAGTYTDASPAVSSGPLVIGRAEYQDKSVDWWDGGIKNVEVFGQALTAAQVQTLFRQNDH